MSPCPCCDLAEASRGRATRAGAHLMRSSVKSMVVPMTCISAAGSIRMRTPRSSTSSSHLPFSSAPGIQRFHQQHSDGTLHCCQRRTRLSALASLQRIGRGILQPAAIGVCAA